MNNNKLIYRIAGITGIMGYLYLIYVFIWGMDHTFPCMFYETTGYPCPSCGLTRAMMQLLHGNITDALRFNPLSLLLALYLLLLPVLLLTDLGFKRNTFQQFTDVLFRMLNTPSGAAILLTVILLNWLYLIFYAPL
ncbi:MAG: DUF2752 domain-containing protein [Bacteroidales bacterium]